MIHFAQSQTKRMQITVLNMEFLKPENLMQLPDVPGVSWTSYALIKETI